MRIFTCDMNFSQSRGTPYAMVGEISRRFWATVSGLSTKLTTYPYWMCTNTEKIRS